MILIVLKNSKHVCTYGIDPYGLMTNRIKEVLKDLRQSANILL